MRQFRMLAVLMLLVSSFFMTGCDAEQVKDVVDKVAAGVQKAVPAIKEAIDKIATGVQQAMPAIRKIVDAFDGVASATAQLPKENAPTKNTPTKTAPAAREQAAVSTANVSTIDPNAENVGAPSGANRNDNAAVANPRAAGDYPASVDWKKVNASKAKVNKTLNSAKFSKNNVKFSYESLKGWPVKSIKLSHGPGNADVNAYVCIFVMRNGKLTGGKFNWLRVGQGSKDLSNIRSGYVDGIKPVSGEVCYFSLVSLDGKQATNLIEGRWP